MFLSLIRKNAEKFNLLAKTVYQPRSTWSLTWVPSKQKRSLQSFFGLARKLPYLSYFCQQGMVALSEAPYNPESRHVPGSREPARTLRALIHLPLSCDRLHRTEGEKTGGEPHVEFTRGTENRGAAILNVDDITAPLLPNDLPVIKFSRYAKQH